jgi:hypothetical protein
MGVCMETIIDQLAKIEKEAITTIEATKKMQKDLADAHKLSMEEYDKEAEAKKIEKLNQMKKKLREELETEHESELKKVEEELHILIDYYENHKEERVNEIIREKGL